MFDSLYEIAGEISVTKSENAFIIRDDEERATDLKLLLRHCLLLALESYLNTRSINNKNNTETNHLINSS